MAASKKRKLLSRPDNAQSDESSDENYSDEEELPEEEIQLDLDGYPANDGDFHGIKQLLQQLFLKAHIDLSQMANSLIELSGVTLVIKNGSPSSDEDDDDEDSENNFCFGVSSILNLTLKKDKEWCKQLKNFIYEKCKTSCSAEECELLNNILDSEDKQLGFIINERLVNIPARIACPIFENLRKDTVEDANQPKKKFNFSNYVMISKICIDKSQPEGASNVHYVNEEEELFAENAIFKFDYSVKEEKDSEFGGQWDDDDMEWEPMRRIIVFEAKDWEPTILKLKEKFS